MQYYPGQAPCSDRYKKIFVLDVVEELALADINGDDLVDSVNASLILVYNAYLAVDGTLNLKDWFASLRE